MPIDVIATIGLPLLTLTLGAGLGAASGLLLERRKEMNGVAALVVGNYLTLRQQLCEELSDLANLQVGPPLDEAELSQRSRSISKLYYRCYDLLPTRALQELNCLYACLSDRENRLFVIRRNELRMADEVEILDLIKDISLVANFQYYALIPLKSGDRDARRAASINYQARRVLRVINQDLSTRQLIRWARNPRK